MRIIHLQFCITRNLAYIFLLRHSNVSSSFDVEHPTNITMSRVRMASDTCGIYFTYLKVNHLLYTCPLDPFEDGILLDIPLVCIHRYCRSFMDDEEECKSQGSPTSSVREAWKRRWKKTELQQSYNHRTSGHPQTRRPKELQPTSATKAGRSTTSGRPTSPSHWTYDAYWISSATYPEANCQKSDALRTSGPPRATGYSVTTVRPILPVRSRAFGLVPLSQLPFRGLDYK